MIKAVIDTNIFISGLLGGKTTRPVINAFKERKFRLVISNQLLDEFIEVVSREKFAKKITQFDTAQLIFLIELEGKIITPQKKIYDCRDAKDNIFLECAVEGKADYIVSNDDDLLVLDPYKGIRILNQIKFSALFKG